MQSEILYYPSHIILCQFHTSCCHPCNLHLLYILVYKCYQKGHTVHQVLYNYHQCCKLNILLQIDAVRNVSQPLHIILCQYHTLCCHSCNLHLLYIVVCKCGQMDHTFHLVFCNHHQSCSLNNTMIIYLNLLHSLMLQSSSYYLNLFCYL